MLNAFKGEAQPATPPSSQTTWLILSGYLGWTQLLCTVERNLINALAIRLDEQKRHNKEQKWRLNKEKNRKGLSNLVKSKVRVKEPAIKCAKDSSDETMSMFLRRLTAFWGRQRYRGRGREGERDREEWTRMPEWWSYPVDLLIKYCI